MKVAEFTRRAALTCVLLISACSELRVREFDSPPLPKANLILTNAIVYTVDSKRRVAQAVAVAGNKIIFVGSDKDARAHRGPDTKVVDLAGKMLLPGFQDAHVHPVAGAWALSQCYIDWEGRLAMALERISGCESALADGQWLRGEGWSTDMFPPEGRPDKRLLDRIAPDRPAAFYSYDGHSLWANSIALALAGIDAATPDPVGGVIDRDAETLEPLGGLHEDAAMKLVADIMPPISDQALADAMMETQHEFNALGITAVHDASSQIGVANEYRSLEAYQILARRGVLTLRVRAAMKWEPGSDIDERLALHRQVRHDNNSGLVRAAAIKIYQDGVLENGTASLLEPYLDRQPGATGLSIFDAATLKKLVIALDAADFQVHFHAIGDRAVRDALDAVAAARHSNGAMDNRHTIAHLELIAPADISRFAELGVSANFQPLWAYSDTFITEYTQPKIGDERTDRLYPIGSVAGSGARIAFGSDWSVTSQNPLLGIETAVTRLEPTENSSGILNAKEGISVAEAIAAYTIHAAYVNFLDDSTGSIEVGKLADLIVLDRNLLDIPATEISDVRVLATLFGGKLVFGHL